MSAWETRVEVTEQDVAVLRALDAVVVFSPAVDCLVITRTSRD
jgi:hypothetical protein